MDTNDINQCALKWHISRKDAEDYINGYKQEWEVAIKSIRSSGYNLKDITITAIRGKRRKNNEEENIN